MTGSAKSGAAQTLDEGSRISLALNPGYGPVRREGDLPFLSSPSRKNILVFFWSKSPA
jgi:hypothetical protein